MKLYIVRHGESKGNIKQGFISGQTDKEGLSEKGRIQIARTSWELRNLEIDALYASPVARAQETAQILGSYLGQEVHTLPWLTELHHGIFEGYYWWEVIHKIPPSWRARREDFRTPYPGGESMEALLQRVSQGLFTWLSQLDDSKTYLMVSHQAVITTIRYCLEHGPYTEFLQKTEEEAFLKYLHEVKLDNGCYVQADLKDGKLRALKETSAFDPVKPDKNSVLFYAKTSLPKQKIHSAERQETASGNAVYELHGDETSILKVVRDKDAQAFDRQVQLYSYLNSQKIPSPKIMSVDQSRAFFSQDVLVQDFVEGSVIKQCFLKHPEKTQPLLEKVYQSLTRIHSLAPQEVKNFWKPPLDAQFLTWSNFMILNINMTLHMIQEGELADEHLSHVQEALSCLKDYVREGRYEMVPIHGDVGSDNIIVAHDPGCKLIRLIDFEWARIGDSLWDFAYFWGWIERDNSEAALIWKKILEKRLPDQMIQLNWYRILFHAWTLRDMVEYTENPIRLRRGKKSLQILQSVEK